MRRLILIVLLLLVATPASRACTCLFVFNATTARFARNYDWGLELGVLTVNNRGVAKTALSFENPASWVSRYGSVTFNQYGRELPNDGMNEAGLVVAVMWLNASRYPTPDERPSVGSAQWVQYQLDTAATVADVLASDDAIRISPNGGGMVHYLVADAAGNAAVVEWIDGERVVHTGDDLAVKALTNDTYERSLAYLAKQGGVDADKPMPGSRMSLDRFARAAVAADRAEAAGDWSDGEAFAALASVAQGDRTKWSIVYDARAKSVRFKTHSSPAVKRLGFAGLDFSTDTPVQVLDISDASPGDAAPQLRDYTTEQNLRNINAAFDATLFLKPWPQAIRKQIAEYPETACRPAAPSSAAPSSAVPAAAAVAE